jgi:hypothetical protein
LPRLGAIGFRQRARPLEKAAGWLRVIRNPSRAYPSREWWQPVMTVQLNIGGALASVKFVPAVGLKTVANLAMRRVGQYLSGTKCLPLKPT